MALVDTTLWTWARRNDISFAYRGPDRRRASVAPTQEDSSVVLPAFLVGSQLFIALTYVAGTWSPTTSSRAAEWLTPSVAVISALAAGVTAVRWRLVGDAAALWVASALFVYSAVNVAFPDLLQTFVTDTSLSAGDVLRPASVIVVMALFVVGAIAPAVDASLRPRVVALWTGGLAAVALAASMASADIRLLFGPAIEEAPVAGTSAVGQIGIGAVWLSLSLLFLVRARRAADGPDAWLSIMFVGLAEARLALAMSVDGAVAWMLVSQVARLLGVVAGVIGAVRALERSYLRQRSTLLVTDAELTSARARHAAERATVEERAHDLRSALAGIGSAAVTLERYHDSLTDDERAGLARAVAAEIDRLQRVVTDVRAEPRAFDLADAMDPLVRCARAQGATVNVGVSPACEVVGAPADVLEILQNLIDNARRHAPGSAVDITARVDAGEVVVAVEDRGPGVDPAMAASIFDRGVHGGADGSSGLGLYVAARLARSHGSELRFSDRPGGGASFSFSLPRADQGGHP